MLFRSNDTATTEIYTTVHTLSLHDALPISLDRRLGESRYLAGDEITIADFATFPWYGAVAKGLAYDAAEFLQVQDYKNVQRWTDTILARPAVIRGRMVNRVMGEPSSQLHERHDAGDFLTKTQDKVEAVAK